MVVQEITVVNCRSEFSVTLVFMLLTNQSKLPLNLQLEVGQNGGEEGG